MKPALFFLFTLFAAYCRAQVPCPENFSEQNDSHFCNYYIDAQGDSVFYCASNCILLGNLDEPSAFRRSYRNGPASGELKVYEQEKGHYRVVEAFFRDGYIVQGSVTEFYSAQKKKMSGQYFEGKPFGIWLYYHPNGNLSRIITFENGEIRHEKLYNSAGKLTGERAY